MLKNAPTPCPAFVLWWVDQSDMYGPSFRGSVNGVAPISVPTMMSTLFVWAVWQAAAIFSSFIWLSLPAKTCQLISWMVRWLGELPSVCGFLAVACLLSSDSQRLASGGSASPPLDSGSALKIVLSNFIASVCSCSPESAMYFFIAALPFFPKLSLIVLKMALRSFAVVVVWRGGGSSCLPFRR